LSNIHLLESANRDLDRFAFMASHDLQEPLRKIQTFSDLLYTKHKNILDADAHTYVDRIQKAAARMQALIKDILAFSKLTGEKDNFEFTDLNILLNEALGDLEGSIQEKQAKVSLSQPLPALEVNPGLIRPLFYNLIGNALKYSKKEVAPQINIRYEMGNATVGQQKDQGPKFCRLFIEDNGIGFDQIYADQVFEMFRRLHVNTEFEGTGIGLALCKKIVEKHHGSITAKSKVNEGTTFTVMLPVQQPQKITP
jgi:light-regulated signal transduction histidine kinase (bacteriophytochrome)